jgi:hypothetical protein
MFRRRSADQEQKMEIVRITGNFGHDREVPRGIPLVGGELRRGQSVKKHFLEGEQK